MYMVCYEIGIFGWSVIELVMDLITGNYEK